METEASLVYQLLDQIRGGRLNTDEVVTERDIRSYLRDKRSSLIQSTYKNGLTVTEDEFQSYGVVEFTFGTNSYFYDVSPVVRLLGNSGIKVYTSTGYSVPIMRKSDYRRALKNSTFGNLPMGYLEGSRIYVKAGSGNLDNMDSGIGLDNINDHITNNKTFEVEAILFDPSSLSTYDWTSDPYPLNPSLLSKLKESIKRTDLAAILQTKEDEITNGSSDTLRYHDKGKIQ